MKKYHLISRSDSIEIDVVLPEKQLYKQLKSIHKLHMKFSKINKKEGKLNVFIRQCDINTGPNVENVPGENRDFLQSLSPDNGNVQAYKNP